MKLSNIKYFDLFFRYQRKNLEKIVFVKDKFNVKDTYDVAVVFGGVSMIPYRLDAAIDLDHDHKVEKILASGGIGYLSFDRKNKEAFKMQEYLLSKGVNEQDIIIEYSSRNTYENVINSAIELNKYYSLEECKCILITSDFHLRRCMALINKNTSLTHLSGIGVKDSKNDLENWKYSFKGRKNILIEAFLLCYYAKKGKIDDIDIDLGD